MFKFIKIIVFFLLVVNNTVAQRISVRFFDQSRGKKIYTIRARDSVQASDRITEFVNRLRDRGFLEASADSVVSGIGEIRVYVHKGQKYFIDTLIVIKNSDSTILGWKKQIFTPSFWSKIIDEQILDLRNNGYPFAHVVDQDCHLHERHFSCTAKIERGDFYVWDTLKIVDSVHVSKRFLQNYLSLRPGRPFVLRDFEQIQFNLSCLDFLTMTDTPQIEFYPGLARPVLSLSRRRVNSASALVGMSYENGRLVAIGHINVRLKALLQAEDFSLAWDRPRAGWQQLKASLQVPYLGGLPVGVDMRLFSQKIDTTQLNLSLSVGLSYFFHGLSYITFSWHSENNLTTVTTQSDRSVKKRLLSTSFFIDSRDNSLLPSQGFLLNTSVSYGRKRIADSLSWSMSYGFDVEKFTKLRKNISVLMRLRTKAIVSPQIFDNEVMHIGGYGDFRGFGEQQLRATAYYLLTIEPRLRLGSSYLLFFADRGLVQTHTITTDETLHTFAVGLGINLMLRSAILNLTYALGTTDRSLTARASKIHISYRLIF